MWYPFPIFVLVLFGVVVWFWNRGDRYADTPAATSVLLLDQYQVLLQQ